jgi:hypothetical protein
MQKALEIARLVGAHANNWSRRVTAERRVEARHLAHSEAITPDDLAQRLTDLSQDAQCHSAGECCAPMFAHAGVDWDTGQSLPTQSVYRVEPR